MEQDLKEYDLSNVRRDTGLCAVLAETEEQVVLARAWLLYTGLEGEIVSDSESALVRLRAGEFRDLYLRSCFEPGWLLAIESNEVSSAIEEEAQARLAALTPLIATATQGADGERLPAAMALFLAMRVGVVIGEDGCLGNRLSVREKEALLVNPDEVASRDPKHRKV